MRPSDVIPVDVIPNIKSLPKSVKDWIGKQNQSNIDAGRIGEPIQFSAYLCMKAADGSIVNGWLASQTDMLSSDWTILE